IYYIGGIFAVRVSKNDHADTLFSKAINILGRDSLTLYETLLKADALFEKAKLLKEAGETDQSNQLSKSMNRFLLDSAKAYENRYDFSSALILYGKLNKIHNLKETFTIIENYCESLLNAATILEVKGRWNSAAGFYEEARTIQERERAGNSILSIKAFLGTARIYSKEKDYSTANKMLEEIVESARKNGALCVAAEGYYYLGLNSSDCGDDEQGLKYYDEALCILSSDISDDQSQLLRAFINAWVSLINWKKGQKEDAIRDCQQIIDQLSGQPHALPCGDAYRFLGEFYAESNQFALAERNFNCALDVFEKNSANCEIALTYKSRAHNFLNTGDTESALFYIDEGIFLLEQLGNKSVLPQVYRERAKICILLEEYNEAERLLKKDFEILRHSKDQRSLAYSYYYLGKVKRLNGHLHSAADTLKRSLALFAQVKDRRMEAHALLELSLCESGLRNADTAIECCAMARDIINTIRSPLDTACELSARGVVLRDCKDARRWQKAQQCFEDSIRIQRNYSDKTAELADTCYEFALLLRDIGNKKQAEAALSDAVEIAGKIGLVKKMNSCMKVLAQINPAERVKIQMGQFMSRSAVEEMSRCQKDGDMSLEKKQISILFTDIRGFSGLAEKLSLPELSSLLNNFYNLVDRVMLKFKGKINKFIGDAVLVFFNIDDDLHDHPFWAICAAVELIHAVEAINLIIRKKGQMPIYLGVGVNTGEVIVGTFGSGLCKDYTAIGDCVNVASRLQQQAMAGEIVISDSTYELVKEYVVVEDMGDKSLKGKEMPVRLWKVKEIKESIMKKGVR
ncbi:MAG: adenylate/guanylate cyclase domain-containing protein, partial [bacterium]